MDYAQFESFAGNPSYSSVQFVLSSYINSSTNAWIIDTCTSRHMCNNSWLMSSVKGNVVMYMPNGKILEVTHTGEVVL